MSTLIAHHLFTATDYHRMVEAGILTENDRVELINGEITQMSPIGARHAACVKRLNTLLIRFTGQQCIVSVQDSIRLGNFSEPEPDVALLRYRKDFYAAQLPVATDVFLLIEVADSALNYDQEIKLPLYAKASVPEVWIVNLNENLVETYRQPTHGTYGHVQTYQADQTITASTLPTVFVQVKEVLG